MIVVRPANQRGGGDHGWLKTRHAFSFSDYYDEKWMGFRFLRVLNEDVVEPGRGFPTHPHRDAEIVSYVLEGALEHKDSMGNGSVIRPGEVQRMSAGTGVTHSENNHSETEPVHFLQIWFLPDKRGYPPSYEQKGFSEAERRGKFRLVASQDGRDGSVTVHQDVRMYSALLSPGESTSYTLEGTRHAWIHVARGVTSLNGTALSQGDGAAISEERNLVLNARELSEVLLFDMA